MGHLRVTVGHPWVTMGHLSLTVGYLKAIVVHIRVTLGHLRVTIGNFFLSFTPKYGKLVLSVFSLLLQSDQSDIIICRNARVGGGYAQFAASRSMQSSGLCWAELCSALLHFV